MARHKPPEPPGKQATQEPGALIEARAKKDCHRIKPMPIYEFYCPDNHRIYSFLARSLALAGRIPRCPENPAYRLVKVPSRFAVTGKHKSRSDDVADGGTGDDPFAGVDDAKMEQLMGEFEGVLGQGDSDPDPGTLGRMMRRLSEVTGQPLSGPMAEMVARMEKGEDPDSLEQEYGDLMEGDGANLFESARQSYRQRPPRRESKLFEMSDYLDEPVSA